MTPRFSRPSPALVVASLALAVALSGTAVAAPLRHFVGSINGADIQKHTISGPKLKDDTVTGTQVNESSLGTVPNSTNADTVDGFSIRKVFYAPTKNNATPKKILDVGGLVLMATCANGDVEVVMTSTVDHAHLSSEMWNSAGGGNPDGLHHSDFGPNSATRLESLGDGNAYGETTFTYTRSDGTVVNGELSFDSSDLNPLHPGDGDIFDHTAKCLVSGFVTYTPSS
jgi:hypothetical protein